MFNSTTSLFFGKYCNEICSISLIREHHETFSYCNQSKTHESSFADEPFTVLFNPVKNKNTAIFSKTILARDIYLPIQDNFIHFLNKLQDANQFSEQPIVVSAVFDELPEKQHLLKLLKWIKSKDFIPHTTGF